MDVDDALRPLIAVVPPMHARGKVYLHNVGLADWDGQQIKWPASVSMSTTTSVKDLKEGLIASKRLSDRAWTSSIGVFASPEDYAKQIRLEDGVAPLALPHEYSKARPLIVALADGYHLTEVGAWVRQSTETPQVLVDWATGIVRIPEPTVWWAGIVGSRLCLKTDGVLFCRHPVLVLWRELHRCCLESNALAYVVGSAGSGKTAATYAFAAAIVDRIQWDVVWLHYEYLGCARGNKWEGDSVMKINSFCTSNIENVLESRTPTIVFFDGYESTNARCVQAWSQCVAWWSRDKIRRRLVCVTSMVSAIEMYDVFKTTVLPACVGVDGTAPSRTPLVQSLFDATSDEPCQPVCSIVELQLSGWTMSEYVESAQRDALFEAVEPALRLKKTQMRGRETPLANRIALVERKYFVAGANAFQMFTDGTDTAVNEMKGLAMHRTLDGLLRGDQASTLTDAAPNQLFTMFYYYRHGVRQTDRRLVSPYIARRLAIRCTTDAVRLFGCQDDPSGDGEGFFGAWLIRMLSSEDTEWWERSGDGIVPVQPTAHSAQSYDSEHSPREALVGIWDYYQETWQAPLRRPLGGFDLIRADPEGKLVEFWQIVHGENSHRFDPGSFEAWLRGGEGLGIRTVRLVVAMPKNLLGVAKLAVHETSFRTVVERALESTGIGVEVVVRGVAYPAYS